MLRKGSGLLPCDLHRGYDAELLQHPQPIEAVPPFAQFSVVSDAREGHACDRHRLAGCRDAEPAAAMCSACGPPCRHHAPLADHIVYCHREIGECVEERGMKRLEAVGTHHILAEAADEA